MPKTVTQDFTIRPMYLNYRQMYPYLTARLRVLLNTMTRPAQSLMYGALETSLYLNLAQKIGLITHPSRLDLNLLMEVVLLKLSTILIRMDTLRLLIRMHSCLRLFAGTQRPKQLKPIPLMDWFWKVTRLNYGICRYQAVYG